MCYNASLYIIHSHRKCQWFLTNYKKTPIFWTNMLKSCRIHYLHLLRLFFTFLCIVKWYYQPLSSVTQSCLTLCDPMDCRTPGYPVQYQCLQLAHTHVHQIGDAIQPFHPLSSPYPPSFNLSQHQGLFECVSSLHPVVKILEI